MATTNKNKTTEQASEGLAPRQVTTKIPGDVHDALEGYAYGTRRRMSQVVRQAVDEFYQNHKSEIDDKKV